jgi:hypothetical protein
VPARSSLIFLPSPPAARAAVASRRQRPDGWSVVGSPQSSYQSPQLPAIQRSSATSVGACVRVVRRVEPGRRDHAAVVIETPW